MHVQAEKERKEEEEEEGGRYSSRTWKEGRKEGRKLKPTEVWPTILRSIDTNPESLKKAELAKDALEEFLLIEPTNASVERDANIVRLVKEATNNHAEANLLDTRVPKAPTPAYAGGSLSPAVTMTTSSSHLRLPSPHLPPPHHYRCSAAYLDRPNKGANHPPRPPPRATRTPTGVQSGSA